MGAGCVERRTPGSARAWGCNSPGLLTGWKRAFICTAPAAYPVNASQLIHKSRAG
jgi:hypothetical protein